VPKEELDQLKQTLTKVETAHAEHEKVIVDLKGENKQLKCRLDSLDAASRLTFLVVDGLPEPFYAERALGDMIRSTEASLRGYDANPPPHAAVTETSLLELCITNLGLNLASKDIEVAYRMNCKNASSSCPIMVTFISWKVRNEVYERRRILRGKQGARVYIGENLTTSTAEIAPDVRQLVKDKRLYSCWTNGGCVFVKGTEAEKPTAVYDHTTLIVSCYSTANIERFFHLSYTAVFGCMKPVNIFSAFLESNL